MLRDAAGAGLLIAAAFVPGIAQLGLQVGELHLRDAGRLSTALLVIQALALVPRRRRPVAGLAVGGLAWGAYQLGGYPTTVAGMALLFLLYSVGAHQERFRAAVAGAAVAGYVALAVALHLRGSTEPVINYATFSVVLAASWGAGAWVRSRQRDELRKREAGVRLAISDERGRIARELHDVVTHHVTAMVVQADMAGLLITADPARATEGIGAVGRSGREALTELRRLLGVLDGNALPESEPGRVADLVDRMRRAGQPVDFAEEGGPGPDGGVGLAVYRVVQEGLTNAGNRARSGHRRVLPRPGGAGPWPDRAGGAGEGLRRDVRGGRHPGRRFHGTGPAAAGGRRVIRVLVCDDQALIRAGFVTVLGLQPDLEVVGEASDGEAAVREARRLRPDVVVMDIQMPLLDGIEATRRLAGPDVPDPAKVLVVTTFNLDKYVYAALRAGASGFLLKDAQPAELIDGIRTVARGEALLAPAVTRRLVGRFGDRVRPTTPRADERLAVLTPRELEVFRLIADGLSNAEIAGRMAIGQETVKTYVSRILTKLALRDRVQAVILAYQTGLVS
jgi:DNA-binding NarL/FixJ family response regulator/signal transduction histidine kinase